MKTLPPPQRPGSPLSQRWPDLPGHTRGLAAPLCLALLTSCSALGSALGPRAGAAGDGGLTDGASQAHRTSLAVSAGQVPPVVGRVVFPGRRVQATMDDVADASTVSLIDSASDTTVATTVTDASGIFQLGFLTSWTPTSGTVYDLEAVKGLDANLPGNSAARVRTFIEYNSGQWQSISAGQIDITPGTTALAIGASLLNNNPNPFNFTSLIGTTLNDTYLPVPGITQSDYHALDTLVLDILAESEDPVAGVALQLPDTWTRVNELDPLTVTTLSTDSAQIGATLTVNGTGFDPYATGDVVRFNGTQAATPSSATPLALTVVVPAGTTTGQVTVQVGNTVGLGPTFTVCGGC